MSKSKALAEAYMLRKRTMKTSKLKHPRMVDGVMQSKLRKDESDIESDMPPKKYPGMSEGRQKFAEGGKVQGMGDSAKARSGDDLNDVPEKEGWDQYRARTDWQKMRDENLASSKPQKLAEGGAVKPLSSTWESEDHTDHHQHEAGAGDDMDEDVQMAAEGGMIGDDELEEEHHESVADAIMARRKYAEGGMVDLEANDAEEPHADFDELNEAALKENYDTEVSQPEDSNLHRPSIEDDKHDRVSAIRRKMRK